MIDREKAGHLQADYKSSIYSLDSIFSEMSIATIMMNIVQTDKVKSIFRAVGVDSIDLVEPLMGVIDRRDGRKYVVYEHQKGVRPNVFFRSDSEGLLKIKGAINRFASELEGHLIKPYDIDEWQFLYEKVSGQTHMQMIDIEMYHVRRVGAPFME